MNVVIQSAAVNTYVMKALMAGVLYMTSHWTITEVQLKTMFKLSLIGKKVTLEFGLTSV